MFCRQCGKEVSEGAVFCNNCGARVKTEAVVAAEAAPEEKVENKTESAKEAEGVKEPQVEGAKKAKKEKKKGKGGIIALVILAMLLVGGGVGAGLYFTSDSYNCKKNLKLAEESCDEGEYEDALEYYEAALELDPSMVDIYEKCADLYVENDDYEEAVKLLENGIKENKEEEDAENTLTDKLIEVYSKNIEYYIADSNFAQAFAVLDEAAAKTEADAFTAKRVELYSAEADFYLNNGDYAQALTAVNEGIAATNDASLVQKQMEIYSQQVAMYSQQADNYWNVGDYEQALAVLGQAISVTGDASLVEKQVEIYKQEAESYANAGDYEQAIEVLDEAISVTGDASLEQQRDKLYVEKQNSEYPFEVADLGGYVFTVADTNEGRWFPEEGSSEIANAIINRVNTVEQLFNCTIEYRKYDEKEFANAVAAGEKYADIIVCETWSTARHIGAGYVIDLAELEGLNMEADYWTANNTRNLLTYQGKVYGASAPFASQADEVFVMFYNRAIIEELGLEDPQDLYARDEWTFSKFLEYEYAAKKDLNGDGVFDTNDRYGMVCGHDWETPIVMYLASGNEFYHENEDGTFKFALNTPEAFNAVNQVKEMMNPGDTFWPKPEDEEMEAYAQAFADGKALFYTYSRGRGIADTIYDMEDDFGLVPIPRGDDAETYRCWVSHDAPSIAIPSTNPDKDKTAMIVEALAYFAQEENELALEEYCNTKLRDDKSAEILRDIPQYACSDIAFIAQQVAEIEIPVETGIEDFIKVMLGEPLEW